jgi:hypothetical protein
VPQHEIDLLVCVRVRPLTRSALTLRAIVTSLARGVCVGWLDAVALSRQMNAECDRLQILGPLRIAIGADGEPFGETLVARRIVDDLLRSTRTAEARESEHRVALVAERPLVRALQHREAVPLLGPYGALVRRCAAVEDRHGAFGHVAQLDPIADFVLRIDGPGEQSAVTRECEVGDVADVQLLARRELPQDQIGSAWAIGRCSRSGGRGRRGASTRCRLRRLPLQRDPGRRVTREGEAPDARVLALLASREVDDRDPTLHGTTHAP